MSMSVHKSCTIVPMYRSTTVRLVHEQYCCVNTPRRQVLLYWYTFYHSRSQALTSGYNVTQRNTKKHNFVVALGLLGKTTFWGLSQGLFIFRIFSDQYCSGLHLNSNYLLIFKIIFFSPRYPMYGQEPEAPGTSLPSTVSLNTHIILDGGDFLLAPLTEDVAL